MAAGKYVVTWPQVRVQVKDKLKKLKRDDLVPSGVALADLQNLVSFGAIAGVREVGTTAAADEPAKPSGGSSTSNPDTVEAILERVGDDKNKAAEALKTEKAKGEAARSTLVDKLESIVKGS